MSSCMISFSSISASCCKNKRPAGRDPGRQGEAFRGTTCLCAFSAAPHCPFTRETAPLEVRFGGAAHGGIPHHSGGGLSACGPASLLPKTRCVSSVQRLYAPIIAPFFGLVKWFLKVFPPLTSPRPSDETSCRREAHRRASLLSARRSRQVLVDERLQRGDDVLRRYGSAFLPFDLVLHCIFLLVKKSVPHKETRCIGISLAATLTSEHEKSETRNAIRISRSY